MYSTYSVYSSYKFFFPRFYYKHLNNTCCAPPPPISGHLRILAHPHDSPSLDVHLCYAIFKLPYRYTEWSAAHHGHLALD